MKLIDKGIQSKSGKCTYGCLWVYILFGFKQNWILYNSKNANYETKRPVVTQYFGGMWLYNEVLVVLWGFALRKLDTH